MNIVEIFLIFVVAFMGIGLIISINNARQVKRLSDFEADGNAPLVSILVPARDEEKNIEGCVTSLLAQDYANFEVIVLNDHSTDRTGAILCRLAQTDSRLRIINGKELPEDWPGKHWACQQLSQTARGEFILFTDADTYHQPGTLRHAVAAMLTEHVDLLTALPHEEVVSWGEKLIVPFMNFGMLSFLPLFLALKKQTPAFSVTIGQFMLFRRAAYEDIGGYEEARSNVNDDVLLGRLLMEKGYRWCLVDGTDFISCRMYHNLSETIEGFSKNVFGFFDYRILPFVFTWMAVAAIFLEPLYIVCQAFLAGQTAVLAARLALVAVLETMLLVFMAYRRMGIPLYMTFFYWLTIFLFVLVAMRSMVLSLTGHASWKGRTLKTIEVRWI
jgi:chlorobactene glucosyltransferase